MRRVTTAQAAALVGVGQDSFRTWARRRALQPVGQVRLGRATVNLWDADEVLAATTIDPEPWRKHV